MALTRDDMAEWSVNMIQCFPTIKNLDSEADIAYWERLMSSELGETVIDPDELSLTIFWAKKAIERDSGLGAPTPIDLAKWVKARRRHIIDRDHWSNNQKKVDEIAESMRSMDPNKRYEEICRLEPMLAGTVGPLVEAMPGGLGNAPKEIARSLKRFLATIGTDQEALDPAYIILSGGEPLEETDEYYDARTTRWFPLGKDSVDKDGHRRRYVKYKNTQIRRLVPDPLAPDESKVPEQVDSY